MFLHDSVPHDNVSIENVVVRHAVVGIIQHADILCICIYIESCFKKRVVYLDSKSRSFDICAANNFCFESDFSVAFSK